MHTFDVNVFNLATLQTVTPPESFPASENLSGFLASADNLLRRFAKIPNLSILTRIGFKKGMDDVLKDIGDDLEEICHDSLEVCSAQQRNRPNPGGTANDTSHPSMSGNS